MQANGIRETPLLFVDDEFIGTFDQIIEKNETGELDKLLNY